MTLRRAAVVLALCCLWVATGPAAEQHLPIDQVKPGQVGLGHTVFQGETLESFKVHILGVLRSVIAPGRDLILARLEGGPLAKTGVIAGMSGSPVYIDGRLAGAVAYSLGSFTTEPIAGITPIGEMIETARLTAPLPPGPPVEVPSYITADALWRTLARTPGPSGVFPVAGGHLRQAAPGLSMPDASATLRRIATPLSLSGLDPVMAAPLTEVLARAGFVATQAPGGAHADPARGAGTLRPGDPIGVTLLSGDYNVGATGTVTAVDGTRVYAFGHPLYNLGPVRLPMTRAYVETILPSLQSSTKIASTGAVIGTFSQDRATVLAGTLGPGPDTIPITIALENPQGQRRQVRLSAIENPFFTPLLAFVSLGSALSTFERDLGVNTYALRARIQVRGHDPIAFDDVFTGDGAATAAAASLSVPLAALISNDREHVRIEQIAVEVRSAERARVSAIERVWVDAGEIRPGRRVPVKILLRPYRGPDEIRTVPIDIPAWADSPLTLVVADGARFAQFEQRDGQAAPAPQSVAQLVAQLRQVRRNNRVYVRLFARDAGATAGGTVMPGLPNSVLAVIEGDRAASGGAAVSGAPAGAWDLAVDHAVTGIRTLTVTPVPFVRLP